MKRLLAGCAVVSVVVAATGLWGLAQSSAVSGYPEFAGGADAAITVLNSLLSIPTGLDNNLRYYAPGGPVKSFLYGLAMMAVSQMEVEEIAENESDSSSEGERITSRGGAFGGAIAELLALPVGGVFDYYEETEIGCWVEHVEDTPEMQRFEFDLVGTEFVLVLAKTLGHPEKGLDWGILGISREDYAALDCWSERDAIEYRELTITEASVAFYTRMVIDSWSGDLLAWYRLDFVAGGASPVGHDGPGLQCP